ncbi:MAG: amino acid racemase [Chthoniobacterales bacterium]|nr:amino acid racemase [Chthoniobacterales bacterium]
MKTLGIVGGIGPESTIEYYRFILDSYRTRVTDGSAPHLLIDSIDVNRGIAMLEANDRAALADYLSSSVERLVRAGAEVGLIAANTPHIVFEEVQQQSAIPLLSIVEAACQRARALGLQRLALLGTGFTMRGRFYPEVFSRAGIELVTPTDEEKAFIHQKYIDELLKNQFLPETRAAIVGVLARMRREDGIAAVVLAGTELPLLLRGAEPDGLPFLDTTLIHVAAAVDAILPWLFLERARRRLDPKIRAVAEDIKSPPPSRCRLARRCGRGFVERTLIPLRTQNLLLGAEDCETGGDAFVFLDDSRHFPINRSLANEALEFLVGAEAQHFFATTGCVSFAEVVQDNLEERLEFVRGFRGEYCHQFFGDIVRSAPGERSARWFSHRGLYHGFEELPLLHAGRVQQESCRSLRDGSRLPGARFG